MISAYPRTVNLIINGMDELVRHDRNLEKYHTAIAERIIAAMDEVVTMQSLLPKADLLSHYKRTLQLLGGGMSGLFTDEELQTLIAEKVQNGIY